MNICMVAYSFYESDTRILQYTSALIERGDSVDVISLRPKGASSHELFRGARVFRIMGRDVTERKPLQYLFRILEFLFLSMLMLARLHLRRKYDAVHVHSVPDFLVFSALVPKLTGSRIILDIHDILPEFYASKFRIGSDSLLFKSLVLCERVSARFADHVIVANELWRDRLLSRSVRPGKCTAIRNYPDPAIFSRPTNAPKSNGKFRILYPGTLNYHQGLDVALRAFAKIADKIPNAEFCIYGQGSEKDSLIALRDELGLVNRVHIDDFLPVDQIASIMARADLAVVPKRASSTFGNEAASTKIIEFMSLGVPVIVSRTRIDSFYHNDTMVLFVEPENEEALAQAILSLWRDPARRLTLAQQGLRYVERNNWEAKKAEYFQVIDTPQMPDASPLKGEAHA